MDAAYTYISTRDRMGCADCGSKHRAPKSNKDTDGSEAGVELGSKDRYKRRHVERPMRDQGDLEAECRVRGAAK